MRFRPARPAVGRCPSELQRRNMGVVMYLPLATEYQTPLIVRCPREFRMPLEATVFCRRVTHPWPHADADKSQSHTSDFQFHAARHLAPMANFLRWLVTA